MGNNTFPYFNIHLSALWLLRVVSLGMLGFLAHFGDVLDHLWRRTQSRTCHYIRAHSILMLFITLSVVYFFLQPVWRPLLPPLFQHFGQSSPGRQPSWPFSSLWSDRTAGRPAEGKPAGPAGLWWPHTVFPAYRLQGHMAENIININISTDFSLMCWNSITCIQKTNSRSFQPSLLHRYRRWPHDILRAKLHI